jgi:ribosome biogenesis protein Nip4
VKKPKASSYANSKRGGDSLKPLKLFLKKFSVQINLDEALIDEVGEKIFLLNDTLKDVKVRIPEKYYHAGVLLGTLRNQVFHPSLPLISMIAEKAENKIFVNDKTAWLFICGRDIFIEGSTKKNNYTLILNKYGECLGFGIIKQNPQEAEKGVIVQNILDLGDFLRREKNLKLTNRVKPKRSKRA